MSLFDYPRINIRGTVQLNPGTANNDDYAGSYTLPANLWPPPYAGQTLALIDSKMVEPNTYGLSDADFIAWVQQPQWFDTANGPRQTLPAEWNYYGDMGSSVANTAKVVGVQTGPGQVYTSIQPGVPITDLIGTPLSYTGSICDVNSEGSPPATQFFIESLTLQSNGGGSISGKPSKGACQWINFYRNVNLSQDGGAGGYIYHVLLKDQPGNSIDIPGFDDPNIIGAIFRYYLYDIAQGTVPLPAQNPATLQFVATIAPLYAGEEITTGPVGRLLTANTTTIPTPGTNNNGNPAPAPAQYNLIALAPAMLTQRGNLISGDFCGTFPEYFQPAAASVRAGNINPKYDFGPVTLYVTGNGASAPVGPVQYADATAGDQIGWLIDFDISNNLPAQQALQDPNASFQLVHPTLGLVLSETDYYFVSNQQSLYAEQYGPGNSFVNQGTAEPATVSVYSRGQLLPAGSCPPITVWQYRSVPMQSPGSAEILTTTFQPGDPLNVDTSQPGNFLFTFTVTGQQSSQLAPPLSYGTYMYPPYVTNFTNISLRILPNMEDFSQYYVDPTAAKPVGNASLTFDVVYQKVLRTYYLLYPIMNTYIDLSSETAVSGAAQSILDATDPAAWMSLYFMPRTRDMSQSRRTLLQAWCRMQPGVKPGS